MYIACEHVNILPQLDLDCYQVSKTGIDGTFNWQVAIHMVVISKPANPHSLPSLTTVTKKNIHLQFGLLDYVR